MTQLRDVEAATEHRARIRSTALLEPFTTALAHVLSLPSEVPVVAEPSDSQSLLEGRIFGYLRQLFDPERPHNARRGFEISRIWTEENHLELVTRGADLPAALCRLLPAWTPGNRTVEDGIPGLRHTHSERGDGVSFYLAGQPGRVTFTGVSFKDFEECRQVALADAGLRGATNDQPMLTLEARSRIGLTDDMSAGSVVGRRLGLLMHPRVTAIDSWWARIGRFDVELIVPADGPDPVPQILSHLQSPHLAPRLSLRRSDGYHHIMSIEGSSSEIDVRVLRRPV